MNNMNNNTIALTAADRERQITCETITKNALDMNGIRYAEIPLHLLRLAAYQRTDQGKVREIAANWNYAKCGRIRTSYRDGWFWIVDGRTRTEAARTLGFDTVPCTIETGKTVELEADDFIGQGDNVTKISSFALFKARLVKKDPVAMAIRDLCDRSPYPISYEKKPANTPGALGGMETSYKICLRYGAVCLQWIFDTILEMGWHHEAGGYADFILAALRNTYVNHMGDLASVRRQLVRAVKGKSPAEVKLAAMSENLHRGPTTALTLYFDKILNNTYEGEVRDIA